MSTREVLNRRQFVAWTSAALASALGGCSSVPGVRAALHVYHPRFDFDEQLQQRALRAFAETVIPGAPVADPKLTRVFTDRDYPFAGHVGFFVHELYAKSEASFGNERFEVLSATQRTHVVMDLMRGQTATARLVRGAIYAAEVAYYGGIYDPGGCAFIDVPSPDGGYAPSQIYSANADTFRATEATRDGNLD